MPYGARNLTSYQNVVNFTTACSPNFQPPSSPPPTRHHHHHHSDFSSVFIKAHAPHLRDVRVGVRGDQGPAPARHAGAPGDGAPAVEPGPVRVRGHHDPAPRARGDVLRHVPEAEEGVRSAGGRGHFAFIAFTPPSPTQQGPHDAHGRVPRLPHGPGPRARPPAPEANAPRPREGGSRRKEPLRGDPLDKGDGPGPVVQGRGVVGEEPADQVLPPQGHRQGRTDASEGNRQRLMPKRQLNAIEKEEEV